MGFDSNPDSNPNGAQGHNMGVGLIDDCWSGIIQEQKNVDGCHPLFDLVPLATAWSLTATLSTRAALAPVTPFARVSVAAVTLYAEAAVDPAPPGR